MTTETSQSVPFTLGENKSPRYFDTGKPLTIFCCCKITWRAITIGWINQRDANEYGRKEENKGIDERKNRVRREL
jgi:hypothetical protein